MIIGTSFLMTCDANLVDMSLPSAIYRHLFDPMYAQVMLHSFNMAVVPRSAFSDQLSFCGVYCKDAAEVPAADGIPADSSVPGQTRLSRIYGLKIFTQHARLCE